MLLVVFISSYAKHCGSGDLMASSIIIQHVIFTKYEYEYTDAHTKELLYMCKDILH